jgi:Protein of unknown function (DUF3892)
MADVKVTCITKPHPDSPHEHITHLGNAAANWKWTGEQVIASIDPGHQHLLCDRSEDRQGLRRRGCPGAGKAPYMRTHADGDWTTTCFRWTNARCKTSGEGRGPSRHPKLCEQV